MKKFAAVIGYGGMGSWHADHLLKSDVCELAGIYDIKADRCALAESRGIHAYPSLEALLGDERIELVTVAVPNDVHLEVVLQALAAGKNVICEKPVALNLDDLETMIAAAQKAGKRFTVHQNRRFDVDFLAMKALCASGEIGDAIRIESRIHGSRGIPSDWRGEKEHGGGMLYDWGIHLIDQILQIFTAPITSVYCCFDHITNKEVDDGFRLTLDFADGKQAYVEVGTYNFIPMPRFYLIGSKGTVRLEDWQLPSKVAVCKHWHESEVIPVQTAAGLTKTMAPRDSVTLDQYEYPRPKSDVHDYYRNYVRAIDGLEEQLVTHDQMRRDLAVIEAAFRSAETHQVITTNL